MDILKAFVLNGYEHNINILWENDKPLFRASEIAKVLDIKNIRPSITDFDDDERKVNNIYTLGGSQKIIFLTEIGIYRLLMRSNKPIAKPFQKWIANILVSIREKGKYELELKLNEYESKFNKVNKEKNELENNFQKALELEAKKYKNKIDHDKHNVIIEAFNNKYLVYLAKICQKDNKFIIKIGSTKDIQQRSNDLVNYYGSFTLFQVYETPMNLMFERFLQKHPRISIFSYNDEVNGHKSNGELFLVDNEDIKSILTIAKHNLYKFNNQTSCEQIIKYEEIKLKQLEKKAEMINLIDKEEIKKEIKEDDGYIDPIILYADHRQHTQVRGNKIQRYSSDGKLLKTYDSYAFAIRDSELFDATRTGIKNAIQNNTIYKNFRWMELDRNLSDDTIQQLSETKNTKTIKIGYVAMLNMDKNKIVKVFSDQKSICIEFKFKNISGVSSAIKRGSLSRGGYFVMWSDCDKKLQDEYLKNNQLPEKRVANNSTQINQLHPITKNLIKTFGSIDDVIKEYKISRKTLKNAYEYDIICKGYKWQLLD